MFGFDRHRAFKHIQHPPPDHCCQAQTYKQAGEDDVCHSDRSLLGAVAGGAARRCYHIQKHGVMGVIGEDAIISAFFEDKLRVRHSHHPLQPIMVRQTDVCVRCQSPFLLLGQQEKFPEYPQTFSHDQQCHDTGSKDPGSYSNSGDESGMVLESSDFEEHWTARAGILLDQSQRR